MSMPCPLPSLFTHLSARSFSLHTPRPRKCPALPLAGPPAGAPAYAGTAERHVVVGTMLRFSVAMAQKQIPTIHSETG